MMNKETKIILLVPSFPKLSESFILNKFLALLDRGWDVELVCWQSQRKEWGQVQGIINRAKIHDRVHVAWPHRPRWMALLLLPAALLRCLAFAPQATLKYLYHGWKRFGLDVFRRIYLDAEILILKPNVLHIEFGSLAPERMYLKELLDCKILVSFRGYDLNFVGLPNPHHYLPVWESADALHLLGQDLWRRAQLRGCPSEKKHILIPPAIDTAFFASPKREITPHLGTKERPLRILSVGRLEWKKGYEYAFEAIRILLDQGIVCEYRVIGDGQYYEPLTFARHQMDLDQVAELIGAKFREDVRQEMNWADVFLHSAVSEGFCNAVLEAQSMSLPVVCSDADGLAENVEDGLTGFVVPRRNAQALANKLTLLAADPNLRKKMGEAGRERVEQHFRLSQQIERFDNFYHTF